MYKWLKQLEIDPRRQNDIDQNIYEERTISGEAHPNDIVFDVKNITFPNGSLTEIIPPIQQKLKSTRFTMIQ